MTSLSYSALNKRTINGSVRMILKVAIAVWSKFHPPVFFGTTE